MAQRRVDDSMKEEVDAWERCPGDVRSRGDGRHLGDDRQELRIEESQRR